MFIIIKNKKMNNQKNKSNNKIDIITKIKKDNNNENKIKEKDFNSLPYFQALEIDKRNIFLMYLSLLKLKIDIIQLLFYPEEFSHLSLTLSIYYLDFLFDFFMNAFLYTDDIVSEKYHNNTLNLYTSLFLSLTSNLVSNICTSIINKIVTYNEYLDELIKNNTRKKNYLLIFTKLFNIIQIKISIFFFISFIISNFSIYYIIIFCQIYKKSQKSLLENCLMGMLESLCYSVGVSFIICFLRYFSLKFRNKYIYLTSTYLDHQF